MTKVPQGSDVPLWFFVLSLPILIYSVSRQICDHTTPIIFFLKIMSIPNQYYIKILKLSQCHAITNLKINMQSNTIPSSLRKEMFNPIPCHHYIICYFNLSTHAHVYSYIMYTSYTAMLVYLCLYAFDYEMVK